jgi:hypothetical protein
MENHTYISTREAKIAEENQQAGFDVQAAKKSSGLGFTSLDQFLIYADEHDLWPFAIVNGQAVDFFSSFNIELPDDADCKWLTLGELLSHQTHSSVSPSGS